MTESSSSSAFTNLDGSGAPFGPPMIGALLRGPWEAVQRRMLERLHDQGFADLDFAHLNVFQYPGPQGARPSELAARLGMTKQALNYLLGELERLEYLQRQQHPDGHRGSAARGACGKACGETVLNSGHQRGPRKGIGPWAKWMGIRHKVRDVLCCAGHAFD